MGDRTDMLCVNQQGGCLRADLATVFSFSQIFLPEVVFIDKLYGEPQSAMPDVVGRLEAGDDPPPGAW